MSSVALTLRTFAALDPPHAPPALSHGPVTTAEFEALMARFWAPEEEARLGVAVSGGPDSVALALCLHRWALARHRAALYAFVVDHGLRAESAHEAQIVQQRLAAFGIVTEILRWQHPPLASAIHAQARQARYQLLGAACRERDLPALALGHHQEDQAETILMRLARGSGPEGLAGMAEESFRDGVRLLRPFLGQEKQRLIATCVGFGLPFVTDPSNLAPRFARARLRRLLPLLEAEGLNAARLAALGARAREAAQALRHYARAYLSAHARLEPGGVLTLDAPALLELPQAVALRALSACLQGMAPQDYPPERAALLGLLEALKGENLPYRSLHGCLLRRTGDSLLILREAALIREVAYLAAGQSVVWDQRWRVSREEDPADATPLEVRPLGLQPRDVLDRLAPGLRRLVPRGRARAALPALWRNGDLIAIPSFSSAENGGASFLAEPLSPLEREGLAREFLTQKEREAGPTSESSARCCPETDTE